MKGHKEYVPITRNRLGACSNPEIFTALVMKWVKEKKRSVVRLDGRGSRSRPTGRWCLAGLPSGPPLPSLFAFGYGPSQRKLNQRADTFLPNPTRLRSSMTGLVMDVHYPFAKVICRIKTPQTRVQEFCLGMRKFQMDE